MKNLTFKTAMLNDSQPTVNRRSTDGQSQRHCKQTPLSKRWKVLMTLVFLFTFAIGQMWGDETFTISWSSAGTPGYCYSQAGPTGGTLLKNNAIYFMSNQSSNPGVTTVSSKTYLNPQKLGIVFQPKQDVVLSMNIGQKNVKRTCTLYVDAIKDTVYTAFKNSAGTNTRMPAKILDLCGDDHDSKLWWHNNANQKVIKVTVKTAGTTYTAGTDDGSIACLSGATAPDASGYSLGTRQSGTKVASWSTANTFDDFEVNLGSGNFVFKANTCYRIYIAQSSNADVALKSLTFTPVVTSVDLSAVAAPEGYGTVSPTSITGIASGTALSTSSNVLTVAGKGTITATPTTQTAQYTYAFDSWKKSDDSALPSTITSALAVKAVFTRTARTYDVTLHTNDGTINSGNVSSYTFDVGATLPTNVTKASCDFAGWYASSTFEGERVYTIGTDATGDKEYWAKWEAEAPKHDISYTNLKEQSVEGYPTKYSEGIGIASFDALSDVAGFHFTGWSPDAIPADATDDPFVVTAQWVPTYSVTYNLNGAASGTQPTETAKYAGEVFTLAAQGDIVAPANKRFAGWKDQDDNKYAAEAEFTMPGKPVTLTAQWVDVVTYVASFACADAAPANWEFSKAASDTYAEGAATADYVCKFVDGGTSTPSQTAGDGTSDNDVAFAKNTDAIATYDLGFTTTVTALNVTLCGGSKSGFDETIEYLGEDKSTVKKSYVTSLDAGNWKDNAISKTEDVADVRFIRVHGASKWVVMKAFSVSYIDSRTKYDVTFAKNGGSGDDMPTLKYAKDEEVTLPACTFTAPTNMEFDAWTSTDVTISDNKFTMPNKAVTVKATWKAAETKYHVTYNGSGATGSVTDETGYAKDEEVTVAGKGNLARSIEDNAANFYGWNTNSNMYGGTHYDADDVFNMPESDVTLYAVWGFDIEYKLGEGSWKSGYTAPNHYIYGKGVTLPTAENVERDGYTFDGWYSEWHVNNQGGYIDANKRTSVAASDYGNASYIAKWNPVALGNAQSVDFVDFIGTNGTSANWQSYLTSNGYAVASTTGVSLDNNNDFDTGLKMKTTEGNTLSFTVEAGKVIDLVVGMINGMTIAINGGTAASITSGTDATHLGVSHYYSADAQSVVLTETSTTYNIIRAISIHDPYVVSFDAAGGTEIAAMTCYGPALILPNAEKGTETFLGWYVGENKIGEAGASYTPVGNVELVAHWEAVSSDARLSAIEITPNTGVLAPAFNKEVTNYTYTMPYGTGAVPTITGATPNHEGASYGYLVQAENWGDVAEVRGIALSNDTKKYQITMVQGPKDGVEIISIAVKNGNGNAQTIAAEDISGFIGGTATQKLQSGGTKLGENGNYIGFTLANSETLKAGDVIRLNVTATNGASHLTLYQDGSEANLVKDIEWTATEGINLIPIPSEAVGLSTLYIYRKSSVCNPTLSNFAILRPMDPVMTAITIDGRAGEIDPMDEHHFTVTIPYEANLAALTVEPTIVWNGAHATTPTAVVSNGGEWVLAVDGDNTYRVMDKDGDYTDYTITLTRDVKKYTVSFNAQGGSTVQSELVVAGQKLAAAPADPTREDYLFLGWAEAAEGEVVDVTDFVINADKTFYAQWKYENPIVILDENGYIDHDNFFTGMGKGTVNFGGADHNCISFGSTASTIVGATGSNKFIVYNAKTTQTRIKFVLYNTQSSAKNIVLQKVAEGETAPTNVVIEVPSQQQFTTEYYAYNSDENRSMYVYTENTGIKVLQVKVIESGTPIHQAGQAGYVLNLNKGRVFAPSNEDVEFEGLSMKVSSNYKALNSEVLQTQNNLSFKVDELVTMTLVSTGAKYQVSKDPAGSGKEYAAGTNKHTLTQGTWYIVSSTSSNIKFTNISFSEPVANYTRPVNPAYLGTLCWTNDAILGGATLYEFAGKEANNYLVFDEVEENRLEAGKPYIFMPEDGNTEIKVYNIDDAAALTEDQAPVNNMYGTIVGRTLVSGVDDNMYYFSSNHIWRVGDFSVDITVPAYYCYIDYPAVLAAEPAPTTPAPGRRRVTMGVQGEQVVTGMSEIEASETPMKVMIDGQLFIIRGEKMFDVTGKLVK